MFGQLGQRDIKLHKNQIPVAEEELGFLSLLLMVQTTGRGQHVTFFVFGSTNHLSHFSIFGKSK